MNNINLSPMFKSQDFQRRERSIDRLDPQCSCSCHHITEKCIGEDNYNNCLESIPCYSSPKTRNTTKVEFQENFCVCDNVCACPCHHICNCICCPCVEERRQIEPNDYYENLYNKLKNELDLERKKK